LTIFAVEINNKSISQSLFKAGNMAHNTNTGNRHIGLYKYTKHLYAQYDEEKEKKKKELKHKD